MPLAVPVPCTATMPLAIVVLDTLSVLAEFSEAESVVCLCPVSKDRFGYALANGIVGLYGGSVRLWRIKVCNHPWTNFIVC